MPLTEKMKQFAREYFANGGNGTEAYLSAYDTDNRVTASRECHELLKRSDIREYIKTLNIPQERKAQSERQRKIEVLWSIIENPATKDSDRISALNVLNRMQGDYVTSSPGLDEPDNVVNLSDEVLHKLNVV